MVAEICGSLGIQGLAPEFGTLRRGRVYLLSGGTPALARRVVLESLLASLADGDVSLLTDADPARVFDAPRGEEALEAITEGRLTVLQPASLSPRPLWRRHRLGRLLDETERLVPRRPQLIVWHNPGALLERLGGPPERRLEALQHRARLRDWAILLVADSLSPPLSLMFGAIPRWRELLAGLAILQGGDGTALLEIAHWHERERTVAGRRFHCRSGEKGVVAAEDEPPLQRGTPVSTTPLQKAVYVTRRAVDDAPTLPSRWRGFESLRALEEAVGDGLAGCVVIHHDRTTRSRELLQAVRRLRHGLGAEIPLLIRERGMAIRYRDEQLLLRAGITTIVPRDAGFSSFYRICEALHGLEIHHLAIGSLESLVDPAERQPEGKGYLVPARFIEEVERLVELGIDQEIHNALIRLAPLPGISLADAVRACAPKREGDFCTTDRENLYLFLHACRESDIDTALSHLFVMPPDQLFEWDERNVIPSDIREALRLLRETPDPLPDFSDLSPLALSEAEQESAAVYTHPRARISPDGGARPAPLRRRSAQG